MRKIIFSFLAIGWSVASLAQKTVVIKGTIKGDTKGFDKVYLYGSGIKSDSTVIQDGHFELTVPFEAPFMPLMYTQYDVKARGMYSPFGVLVEMPGTVTISDIDITKGLSSGTLSGMKSAIELQQFNKQQADAYTAISGKLTQKFGKAWLPENDPRYSEFEKESNELRGAAMKNVFESFIRQHPDAFASAFALSGSGRTSLSLEDLEKTYKMLSPKRQQSAEGKKVADYIRGVKSSAVGRKVADFTLNTPEEKPLTFSSLQGKYVLIDFWASWCGPCKQSFPHMKEIYARYKGDKFEIYSISIDADKKAWLKGLEEQQLPWLQALDTKNVSQSGFAVTGVPTTYLISPDGKIMAKEVGFNPDGTGEIEKMLTGLFGKGKMVEKAAAMENGNADQKEHKVIPATRMN